MYFRNLAVKISRLAFVSSARSAKFGLHDQMLHAKIRGLRYSRCEQWYNLLMSRYTAGS
jgi:hypothetical protein